MKKQTFLDIYSQYRDIYPLLTIEHFIRVNILVYGVRIGDMSSFPNDVTRKEIIFTPTAYTSFPLLTLLNPNSPFELFSDKNGSSSILVYKYQFVSSVADVEITTYDLLKKEPWYILVKEIQGDLVLKINPVQLCTFYGQVGNNNHPCEFCFRNDQVGRYLNISASLLLKNILSDTYIKDMLPMIDEISLITGTYASDEVYVKEIMTLVHGLKPYVDKRCSIVVGSHEVKTVQTLKHLQQAGVTKFAFPIESLDDQVRKKVMRNRKSLLSIHELIPLIEQAMTMFGDDHVIVRTVIGIGDRIDSHFSSVVARIAALGTSKQGPLWNCNVYMPFTHNQWAMKSHSESDMLKLICAYWSQVLRYVPIDKQYRFKISL